MYLSDAFIEQYKHKEPPFGGNGLGHFVYLRTYSRWLDTEMRREHWYETVRRSVEYSMSLYRGPQSHEGLVAEAEELFDAIFNLRVFPAGRTMWVGGTKAAELSPMSQFNCSFLVIDRFDKFTDLFYVLMLGTGAGFRVLPEDVQYLNPVNKHTTLTHVPFNQKPKAERQEYTNTDWSEDEVLITVGDSREGWVGALRDYFDAISNPAIRNISVCYDSVRPYGEPLKTFGGRASGHEALRDMFTHIHTVILNSPTNQLRPIDCMDIANIIGYYVVVGGVRRTSEICLFDASDEDILNAKVDMWVEGSPNYGKVWRSMSNNSIFFKEKPTREFLSKVAQAIKNNGEPGIINAEAAAKRRPNFKGLNPCAEILLDDEGVCNLTNINVVPFVYQMPCECCYDLDIDRLFTAIRQAVRMGMRITNLELDLSMWDYVQKRDRLIGPSLDGWEQAMAMCGYDKHTEDSIRKKMNKVANDESLAYAKEMRIPAPLLVCTMKPSGTLAQLPTVSSGAHKPFAPFYIRRVRISSSDPLALTMLKLGFPVFPENGQGNTLAEANTWVIEFPVKTNQPSRASDEPAVDQFDRYLRFQKTWTDHNTSITITVKEHEWEELLDTVYANWDDYIAVSFLPSFDSGTVYPLMPYEEIDEFEYVVRSLVMERLEDMIPILTELERENMMTELLDDGCANGVCPVR